MIDFSDITPTNEMHCFVLPQCDTYFLTESLRLSVPFEAYPSYLIEEGRAPLTFDEAKDQLEEFLVDLGEAVQHCTSTFPCIIVSPVPEEVMWERVRSLYVRPIDHDLLAHREYSARRDEKNTHSAAYDDEDMMAFCGMEALRQLSSEVGAWSERVRVGERAVFSTLLDPNLYPDPSIVAGYQICGNPDTSALTARWTTQCAIEVEKVEDDFVTFVDAWPDLDVPTSWQDTYVPLEMMRDTEMYQKASPLIKAFLERGIKPEHDHLMRAFRLDGNEEVIRLRVEEDERFVDAYISDHKSWLAVTSRETEEPIPSVFSALQRDLTGIRSDAIDMSIPEVCVLLEHYYPKTAAVVEDLWALRDAHMRDDPASA